MKNFSDEQVSLIVSHLEELGLTQISSGKYKFKDGSRSNSLAAVFKKLNLGPFFKNNPLLHEPYISHLENNLFNEWDFGPIIAHFDKGRPAVASTSEDMEGAEDLRAAVTSLVPFLDVSKTGDKASDSLLLFNPTTNRFAFDISPKAYLKVLGVTEEEFMARGIDTVYPVYNPYNLKAFYKGETPSGLPALLANLYTPPRWRTVSATPRFGGFIKKLIEHLFPGEEDREYVLDWLHYMLLSRNSTVLCLIGARGTGKGILIKDIAMALVGSFQADIVGQEVLEEKFNGSFKNKRLIFFDEVDVKEDRHLSKFKALANDMIAVEKKGVDAETVENFCSLALTTNNRKDFRIEPQERRFSIPRVTEEPIFKVLSEVEIANFCNRCKDPYSPEIAEFGNWLLERKPSFSNQVPFKGEYFFEICSLSLSVWKEFLIDHLLTENIDTTFSIKELTKAFKKKHGSSGPGNQPGASRFPSNKTTIEEFLFQYRYKGKYKLGEVVDIKDDVTHQKESWGIRVDEEFFENCSDPNVIRSEEIILDDALNSL